MGCGNVLSGKQFEVDARRERFLEVARTLLLEEGYEAVTITRVAEETGFSRGTVYQLFNTREDLVTALGMTYRARLLEAVQRGAAFDGCTREKMVAIACSIAFFLDTHADNARIIMIIEAESVLDRVNEEDRRKMREYDIGIFRSLHDIAEEAVANGDLALRPGLTTQGLCFQFWVMMGGTISASYGNAPLEEIGIQDPMGQAVQGGHMLMDAGGWRPLCTEWDYEETARKVQRMLEGEIALLGRSA